MQQSTNFRKRPRNLFVNRSAIIQKKQPPVGHASRDKNDHQLRGKKINDCPFRWSIPANMKVTVCNPREIYLTCTLPRMTRGGTRARLRPLKTDNVSGWLYTRAFAKNRPIYLVRFACLRARIQPPACACVCDDITELCACFGLLSWYFQTRE